MRIDWEDIGWTVVLELTSDSVCDFRLYRDAALLEGRVQWDGCWTISGVHRMHGCSRRDVADWTTAILRACDAAYAALPFRSEEGWADT